jgi:hypothetical protein
MGFSELKKNSFFVEKPNGKKAENSQYQNLIKASKSTRNGASRNLIKVSIDVDGMTKIQI